MYDTEMSLDQGYENRPAATMFALKRTTGLLEAAAIAAAHDNLELCDVLGDRAKAVAWEFGLHQDTFDACCEEAAYRLRQRAARGEV